MNANWLHASAIFLPCFCCDGHYYMHWLTLLIYHNNIIILNIIWLVMYWNSLEIFCYVTHIHLIYWTCLPKTMCSSVSWYKLSKIKALAKTMNAQECTTLTATCMQIYSMSQCVCLLNIRSIELATYPAPEVLEFSSESVHDIGVGEGTWLCHWKPLHYYNWVMHLRATACLHCHCIDNWPAKHMQNGNLRWPRRSLEIEHWPFDCTLAIRISNLQSPIS